MHIAILTFQGFNELDSLIALGVLNRVKKPGWRVTLACCRRDGDVDERRHGRTRSPRCARPSAADAVIVGSGMKTREIVADPA